MAAAPARLASFARADMSSGRQRALRTGGAKAASAPTRLRRKSCLLRGFPPSFSHPLGTNFRATSLDTATPTSKSRAMQQRPQAGLTPKLQVTLRVNGVERRVSLRPWTTLLDALREYLDLTGTKKGCDHGQCGACTVLVNGTRINSCLTLAVMKDGAEVTTVEGLARGEVLHALQQAFVDHDAFQCGYCTSGQICSAVGLIAEGKAKTADEIRELMSGNICRCGAYPNIVAAIQQAMERS